jgi:addiction module HigA family antidote
LTALTRFWWITKTITEGNTMMTMFNPPHPGETLREDVLPALGLTVTEAAAQLDVTRATLSRVLNSRAAVSPEMALRIEGWLGVENGGSADAWIAQQAAYDLWKARAAGAPIVQRAPAVMTT